MLGDSHVILGHSHIMLGHSHTLCKDTLTVVRVGYTLPTYFSYFVLPPNYIQEANTILLLHYICLKTLVTSYLPHQTHSNLF